MLTNLILSIAYNNRSTLQKFEKKSFKINVVREETLMFLFKETGEIMLIRTSRAI
jgi:hypothetical protein